MSFCASARPLSEVIHLWDFIFAAGAHMIVFCVAARMMLLRSEILAYHNLWQIIGKDLPALAPARAITSLASHLYLKADKQFIDECRAHMRFTAPADEDDDRGSSSQP